MLTSFNVIIASCTPTCACVEIHVCARTHPLGAAPNFHACAEKKDKSAHAHVGVHEAYLPKNIINDFQL